MASWVEVVTIYYILYTMYSTILYYWDCSGFYFPTRRLVKVEGSLAGRGLSQPYLDALWGLSK